MCDHLQKCFPLIEAAVKIFTDDNISLQFFSAYILYGIGSKKLVDIL